MLRSSFSPKTSTEQILVQFDFLSALSAGETISTQSVSGAVYSGVDANPGSLVSGAATVSGSRVTQKIIGGVAGATYSLLCTVTTSLGQTLQSQGYLSVIPAAA